MDLIYFGYFGLFLAAFLAATILPFSSEGILLVMLTQHFDPYICLLLATIGNVLGGIVNYWIGRIAKPSWLAKVGVNTAKLEQFSQRIQKHGFWLALLAWVPLIGDPLTVALGFFRIDFWKVTLLMSVGKFSRYALLVLPWLSL
jgi:membrane protein YqaA with SNARE-associated domain